MHLLKTQNFLQAVKQTVNLYIDVRSYEETR